MTALRSLLFNVFFYGWTSFCLIVGLPLLLGPRIGVDYAGPEWAGRAWRFGLAGSPALSRPFPSA